MIKRILPLIALTLLLGCSNQSTIEVEIPPLEPKVPEVTQDVTITCEHKYDSSRNFVYIEGNAAEKKIDDNLTIFLIVDINNKEVFVNNFELENYNCTKE